MEKDRTLYSVYIMPSRSLTLYMGVTNDSYRRVMEHKNHSIEDFTSTYNIERLVYYEKFVDIRNAIAREKQLKKLASREEDCTDPVTKPNLARLGGGFGQAGRNAGPSTRR